MSSGHPIAKSAIVEGPAGAGWGIVPGRSAGPTVEVLEPRTFLSAAEAGTNVAAWPAAVGGSVDVRTVVRPSVRTVSPAADATGVSCNTSVSADLVIPNGGVRTDTVTAATVYLRRVADGARVPGLANTSAAGDVIVFKPTNQLNPYTKYEFVVTSGVKDVSGATFVPFASGFKTGATPPPPSTPVRFAQLRQTAGAGRAYFCLAVGPDGRLYAGSDDGYIYRFDVKPDGSLAAPTVIKTIRNMNGGARFVTGIAFRPGTSAAAPELWVTHTATSSLELGGAAGANWTGKVSVLSNSKLTTYRDAVVRLPRSVRDHLTNQPVFGPDGALYFAQASQTAMGAPDQAWGLRAERPLSAAVLRLDVAKLGAGKVDAYPVSLSGTYNPDAAGAPLTVYADGVRNAYDLVWHRNGRLYAGGNGSAAGGNTPAGDGAPALTDVSTAETDFLFSVKPGGYYGHPNPTRGHHVLNGGNPTAGVDPYEVVDYPVGTKPDPDWEPAIYDLGPHQAPTGALEYRGTAFGGALAGRLLVCRYSGGDDVLALTLDADGRVKKAEAGLPGLTGLLDPVDLVEDRRNGNLYVIELAAKRITLLKPNPKTAATATVAGVDVATWTAPPVVTIGLRPDASEAANAASEVVDRDRASKRSIGGVRGPLASDTRSEYGRSIRLPRP